MDSTEIVESIFSTAQFYEYINLANIINPKPGYFSQRENMFNINISAASTACFTAPCPVPLPTCTTIWECQQLNLQHSLFLITLHMISARLEDIYRAPAKT